MFDFRLKVFYTVARRLNFTKAANELSISQPAVTKHIKEIEQYFNCRLFERNGNKIQLTPQGRLLLNYAEKNSASYQELQGEISYLNEEHRGFLRMGISTTAAQYIMPKYLALFKSTFPHISLDIHTANTENIENLLAENIIDIGIVEGKTKRSGLIYNPFLKDEMVLSTQNDTIIKPLITLEELKKLSFIYREQGSGSLEVIAAELKKHHIKLTDLNIEIILENNESIKNYLLFSNAFTFISLSAIIEELKSGKLKIIDIEDLNIERYYYFIKKQGEITKEADLFIRFSENHNLKL
ncbi:LysR family transcriptional regulator [Epilithonimonas sp.]|uniref:LysR family transcriptional regulator n=1 Tax=Epilithonimonas sp. TaxID=2894511 RepID=UPI002898F069|nr:LysR family transcriptional regulator [Epilithonimonas sp.]